ncbi:hypothetical protein GCK32_002018 [Trichostrongylus colubriformis]|uniref:Uncharacterized protein n=1 Tax=Trichostrongylus colubriformis TaxID=6319 RepID=A0AAN8IBL7_TRICO
MSRQNRHCHSAPLSSASRRYQGTACSRKSQDKRNNDTTPSSTVELVHSNMKSERYVDASLSSPSTSGFISSDGKQGSRVIITSDDEHELSMLESMALRSPTRSSVASRQLARLHLHEFEDHSDSEDPLPHTFGKNFSDLIKTRQRSSSAGARSSLVRDMEARLAGLRHEKMKSQMSGASRDERLSGLLYDPDFDCYYNPVDDQYYKLQPFSKDL